METEPEPDARALSHVIEELAAAAAGDEVTVEELVAALGRRSFPALVLAPSLLAVSPASGIPGMTSAVGLLVTVLAGQMLWGRKCAWLPGFLTRRRLSATRLRNALLWLQRPVAAVERLSRPRMVALATRPLVVLPLAVMLVIGLIMPLLEFVPTSGTIAGALISVFAMGLLMRDGVLVLLGLALSSLAPLAVWQIAT